MPKSVDHRPLLQSMTSKMEGETRFKNLYEALHHSRGHVKPERSNTASDVLKPTTPLPARTLPGRRLRYFGFGVAILSATVTLTAFSLILRHIPDWLPSRESSYLSSVVYRGTAGTSCDLVYRNDSMVEKAFTINLRSPMHFTFATAKGVDVMWDLFVGQGGRLLLAWISYIVFMDGLTRLLENSSVSYQLYATMVFDTTSLLSTWSTLNAIFTGHGWRGRAFLAWFFVASIYVLGFPAMMSAATGYVSPSTSGFQLPNNTFVSSASREIVYCLNVIRGSPTEAENQILVSGPPAQDWSDGAGHIWSYDPKFNINSTYPLYAAIYKNCRSTEMSLDLDSTKRTTLRLRLCEESRRLQL